MNHSSKYLAIYLVIVHIFLNQYPKYRHLGSITHYMLSFVLVCDAVTPLSLLKYPCSSTCLEKNHSVSCSLSMTTNLVVMLPGPSLLT